MMSDQPDFDDPTRADDVAAPGDTLGPTEATDSDEIRNDDGDQVVDPPDHWYAAHKVAAKDPDEHETLDERLAAEEPDDATIAPAQPDPLARRFAGRHRGQIDGTPEDGDSLFPVIE